VARAVASSGGAAGGSTWGRQHDMRMKPDAWGRRRLGQTATDGTTV
jgi:hypothetical protein